MPVASIVTLCICSTGKGLMITYYKKTDATQPLAEVQEYEKDTLVTAISPTTEELEYLEETFKLELGHLKDALDPFEVPRLEIEKNHYYIFTRYVTKRNESFKTYPILLIVSTEHLIVISQNPNPITVMLEGGNLRNPTTHPHDIFVEVFMILSAQFSQSINAINYQINKITYNVEEIENKDIIKLVNFENYLNDFLNIFIQNDAFLQVLLRKKDTLLFKKESEYLEDLSLEILQLLNRCKSSVKLVTNVRDAYSTILTNNLNQVVKFFTSISVVLMVPTVVASFYGMNVPIPNANAPYMFLLIIGSTILITVAFLWLLIWKKLI